MKYRKGFTLIELLVVIAIIGILSAIILASINNSRKNARDGQRISDVKQLENALELYFVANGYSYPQNIYAGSPLAPYIPKLPVDPSTGANYNYIGLSIGLTNGTPPCTGYHLGVTLENSNNTVLSGVKDADYSSVGLSLNDRCGSGAGLRFNGADPIYDVQK